MTTRRYRVETFGCQMNVHDSRRIEEVLDAEGYAPAGSMDDADVILVNTCSVREKAEHKLMSFLGRLRPLKVERPDLVIAVAGCVAQQEGESLLKKSDLVDLVLGPDNIPELPQLLRDAEHGAPPRARTVFDLEDPRFLLATPRAGEITSFVTVMKGCDERCTFCIVPTTRGEERYRPADEIVGEVAQLVAGGVREVTLLGQTVNSWFDPASVDANKPASRRAPSASEFADLLRRIAREVPDLVRLRYTSPHPRHLTDALIAAHAELSVLPAHVHLPVQSGSDGMLRRMSRRYTREHYVTQVKKLQAAVEGLTLSTDFIVGFPGETDEDFEQTLSLVREVGFVSAFCFKYSPRPHTPALKLGDPVSEKVKSARLAALFEAIAANQKPHLQALVGTSTHVLVEGPNDASTTRFTGRSERHEIVHLEAPPGTDPTGQLVRVDIVEAFAHSLLGVMPGASIPSEPTPRTKTKTPLQVLS